ncbi:4847_t:CDS:2, partial [Funneliformis caledonium]
EAVSKIHAIKDWLRTIEVRDFEKVSLDAEQLDKEAIKIIYDNPDSEILTGRSSICEDMKKFENEVLKFAYLQKPDIPNPVGIENSG